MNDSHGQVFSLKKVVRRADNDLLILFLCKDESSDRSFIMSAININIRLGGEESSN